MVNVVPFIQAVIYSFQDWNGISTNIRWVGLENYASLLSDTRFLSSSWLTVKFVAVSTILVNLLGLILALTLNVALKTRTLLRTLFFMPQVIGSLIIGFIWQFIFVQVFEQLGDATKWPLFEMNWLSMPNYAFAAIILVYVWQSAGYFMVIYLAALQGIPNDIIESASIDGANWWRKTWFIVFPLIRPAMTICIFLAISGAFKMFDLNLSLTRGGPFNSTELLPLHIYQVAFFNNNYTLGTTKAVVFFLILVTITLIQVGMMKRREVEM
ncbi:sugar ABC transporter permease [Paenibacillaceae bacterium]|nr:sugar ABC transporter permease [Paenibacillaceae bacterium]